MIDYKKYIKNIRRELKTYITTNGIKSLVLGISGGADSALAALLAKPLCDELDIPLIGYSISILTNKTEEEIRAKNIGNNFCTVFETKDFSEMFHQVAFKIDETNHINVSSKVDKIRHGNIKARLRMIYLYDKASKNNGLVLSTDNYTEYLLGFWTLHGDVGDYGMIQELWKTEVYGMLEYIRDNELDTTYNKISVSDVINADATDGLGITNTDLDQLLPGWKGSSKDGYVEVDRFLYSAYRDVYELKKFDDPENLIYTSNDVLERVLATRFKRENPVNIPRKTIIK